MLKYNIMKRIFQKPNTLMYRLEDLIYFWWEKSFVRFLIVGGLNTALGYLTTMLLRYTIFFDNPKWIIIPENLVFDKPNTIMFLLLFPISYSLQARLAFRTKWQWQRLLLYPLSSIPNYVIQQGFIFIFDSVLGLLPAITYALAAVLAIPIMFFVIRFFVKANPKQ
jgi:putative flippase GtrA